MNFLGNRRMHNSMRDSELCRAIDPIVQDVHCYTRHSVARVLKGQAGVLFLPNYPAFES